MSTTKKENWKEELKKEYLEHQCEPMEGDEERFAVYENDGELVADWWIEKVSNMLSKQNSYLRSEVEKMKPRYIGDPDMTLGIEDRVKLRTVEDILKMMSEKHE